MSRLSRQVRNHTKPYHRGFHKHTKLTIFPTFVFLYICSFLLYLLHVVLINVKLDVSGSERIAF